MSGIKRMFDVIDENTFLARMDPRTKIVVLVLLSTISIILDNPKSLLSVFVLVSFFCFFSKLSWDKLRILLLFLGVGVWGMMISQALFYSQMPRTVILTIISPEAPVIGRLTNGIFLYKEGFNYGAIQSLRFAITLTFGLVVAWTSEPHDLLTALVKLRVPYRLSFMTTTGIRFLPMIIEEASTVITAQRLRKYNPYRFFGIARTALYTLTPILANCIRRAGILSMSIESRAFAGSSKRSFLKGLKYKRSDFWIMGIGGLVLVTLVMFKFLYWFYLIGIYRSSCFRDIYEIASRYL